MGHSRMPSTPIPDGHIVACYAGRILVVDCPVDAMRLNATQNLVLARIAHKGEGCVLWNSQGAWCVLSAAILQNILQLGEDYAVSKGRSRVRTPGEIGVVRWQQGIPVPADAVKAILGGSKPIEKFRKSTATNSSSPGSHTDKKGT